MATAHMKSKSCHHFSCLLRFHPSQSHQTKQSAAAKTKGPSCRYTHCWGDAGDCFSLGDRWSLWWWTNGIRDLFIGSWSMILLNNANSIKTCFCSANFLLSSGKQLFWSSVTFNFLLPFKFWLDSLTFPSYIYILQVGCSVWQRPPRNICLSSYRIRRKEDTMWVLHVIKVTAQKKPSVRRGDT